MIDTQYRNDDAQEENESVYIRIARNGPALEAKEAQLKELEVEVADLKRAMADDLRAAGMAVMPSAQPEQPIRRRRRNVAEPGVEGQPRRRARRPRVVEGSDAAPTAEPTFGEPTGNKA